MADTNEGKPNPVAPPGEESNDPATKPNQTGEMVHQARLGILQAVERKEISVEDAINLLAELDG